MEDVILKMGKYTLVRADKYQFALYFERPKGKKPGGEVGVGVTQELVGFYGYLDDAMSKVVNLAVMNSTEQLDAQSILEGFRTTTAGLKDAYHISAKGDV